MKKIGVQLYTVRGYLENLEQISQTFSRLKNIGYDNIQLFKYPSDIPCEELGQLAADAGLEICGTFGNFEIMQKDVERTIEDHKKLNTRFMGIVGAFDYENNDKVTEYINKFNSFAEKIAPYGFTYHNHAHEFCKIDGKIIYDRLIEETDKVSFCLDTYWVQAGGGDVRAYIKKLSGRLDILHLKDYGRNASSPFFAPIGDGNLNWDGIMEEAEKAGVKYYVVEQDDCGGENPFDALARSREFLEKYI